MAVVAVLIRSGNGSKEKDEVMRVSGKTNDRGLGENGREGEEFESGMLKRVGMEEDGGLSE